MYAVGGVDREQAADVREQAQQTPALLLQGRARGLQAGLVQALVLDPRGTRGTATHVQLLRLRRG